MSTIDMPFDQDIALAEPAARAVAALNPGRLPRLAATTARAHRLAVDERLHALLKYTFGNAGLVIGTCNVIDPAHAAVVRLRWGMQGASVRIDVSQHPGLASVLQADDPPQGNLRNALAALMLEPLLRAFATLGFEGVEVVSLDRAAPLPPGQSCCAIAFRRATERIDATIEHIDSDWFDALEALVARQCMPFATLVSEINVPGRILIGEKAISITTLETLRPGDVILRAVAPALGALMRRDSKAARLQVVWGRFSTRQLRARADVNHDSLTLTEDPTMSHDIQSGAPLTDTIDTPVEISNLDLPLKLEIDTVSLPVAQLSALRAGYVLELPTPVPDARVRLVTYGQTIGFGELVSVGDHLGVRLTQLSQSHGSV